MAFHAELERSALNIGSVARKADLMFMLQLENSPVLCAYGLIRWAA